MLGHASIVLTADTYVSVLPEVAHEAARETARLVLNATSANSKPWATESSWNPSPDQLT